MERKRLNVKLYMLYISMYMQNFDFENDEFHFLLVFSNLWFMVIGLNYACAVLHQAHCDPESRV